MSISGTYTYWRDDKRQPIEEPWSLRTGKSGHVLKGQRLVHDITVLKAEAEYLAGRCTSLNLTWHSDNRSLKAYYRMDGSTLQWRFADEKEEHPLALAEGAELFPILRAATGPLVNLLADTKRAVVLPNIRNNAGHDEILTPLVAERQASLQSFGMDASHYRYHASEFGTAGADCWVDDRGLLQRLRWNPGSGGIWEVRLENFEGGKQFKGFGVG